MNFKKLFMMIISILLVLVMVCGCSSKKDSDDNSTNSSNISTNISENMSEAKDSSFDYWHIDDKTTSIISYSGDIAEIYNIPDNYGGRKVEIIDDECFKFNEMIEVIIPDTVESIGNQAFILCPNLQKVIMGNNVKKLGENVFLGCTNLKEVVLSKSLSEISDAAFSDCSSLEKIIIPSGVKKIGKIAFAGCKNLKEIHIPSSVSLIDNNAGDPVFGGCDKLVIYAPKGSYAEQYATDNNIPFIAEQEKCDN